MSKKSSYAKLTSTQPRLVVPPVSMITYGCVVTAGPAAERQAQSPLRWLVPTLPAVNASRDTLRDRTCSSSGPLGLRRTRTVAR